MNKNTIILLLRLNHAGQIMVSSKKNSENLAMKWSKGRNNRRIKKGHIKASQKASVNYLASFCQKKLPSVSHPKFQIEMFSLKT
jgi:hypothetical protein